MKNLIPIGLILIFTACTSNRSYEIESTISSDFQGMVYLKKQVGYAYELVASVLITSDGLIAARSLRGQELRKKIEELLGE